MILHPRQVASFLREQLPFFAVYLNPKVRGVVIPREFYGNDTVVLNIGNGLARPILDLEFDEYGFRGTLSFAGAPFECLVPWHAVQALVVPDDGPIVQWRTPVEAAKAPEEFPGRRTLGLLYAAGDTAGKESRWWCPRRQCEVDDCATHGCEGSTCRYRTSNVRRERRAALRLVEGGGE